LGRKLFIVGSFLPDEGWGGWRQLISSLSLTNFYSIVKSLSCAGKTAVLLR